MKHKKNIALMLGTMCCILTFLIVLQLNSIKEVTSTVGQTLKENSLRNEVLKWKERYDITYSELQKAGDTLEKQRKSASENDSEDENLEKELKLNNTLLGLTDVSGKGVTITLKDNPTSDKVLNVSLYLVHDEDLKQVVYELKNAGAEAISINDQRIINTTAITCDGNVVQINGEKLSSPFIIQAIGSPENLLGAYQRPGGYIEKLNDTGIPTDIKKSNNITIPKYNGVINYKYLKNAE